MSKKFSILGGLSALAVMIALNIGYAMDHYGIQKGNLSLQVLAESNSSSGSSGSSSGSSAGGERPKVKYCRPDINCMGNFKITADLQGCVTLFGKKKCGYGISLTVTIPFTGEKENCTGGSDWEDCDACQDECVPENFDWW